MDNLLKTNLALLKKHHPALWEMVTAHPGISAPFGSIFTAIDGKPSLKARNPEGVEIDFHPPSPTADTLRYLGRVPEESYGVVILFGMGLGYAPLEICRQRRNISDLVVFEPEPQIFIEALRHTDLTSLLVDPRLTLVVGPVKDLHAVARPLAHGLMLEDTHLLRHLPSFKFSPAYLKLHDALFPILNEYNVSGASSRKQGRFFLKNRLENFANLHHHRLIDDLAGLFQGRPAIIVSGGPSLDRNIQELKGLKERALLIAVDSTLPALLANGIVPHFVAVMDANEFVYEKVADVAHLATESCLLFLNQATPKVVNTLPCREAFCLFCTSSRDRVLMEHVKTQVIIPGIPTVAHLSLAAASIMGASPIILVGQDLAYPAEQTHAAHTRLTSKDLADRIRHQKKDDMVLVESVQGEKIVTDRGLYLAKQALESLLAANQNTYINTSHLGARISGTIEMSLAEAAGRYCQEPIAAQGKINEAIAMAKGPEIGPIFKEYAAILEKARHLRGQSVQCLKLAEEITARVTESTGGKILFDSIEGLPPDLLERLKELETIDHHVAMADQRVWELLQDITMTGFRESRRLQLEMDRIVGPFHEKLALFLKRSLVINRARVEALDFLTGVLEPIVALLTLEKDTPTEPATAGADQLLRLVRAYMANGHTVTAARLLKEYREAGLPEEAEFHYFLGCINLEWRQETYRAHFARAVKLAPALKKEIDEFTAGFGSRFIEYANLCKGLSVDHAAAVNFLLRGVSLCPGHKGLAAEISKWFAADLAEILTALRESRSARAAALAAVWLEGIKGNGRLEDLLAGEELAHCHYAAGKALQEKGDPAGAAAAFRRAVELSPQNPEFHFALTSCCFETGDFGRGLCHLQEAIERDPGYGWYWEEIGDILFTSGQYPEAISAYEQCFLTRPSQKGLLTKMGNCYHALGQPAAAAEARAQAEKIVLCS